jgi:hypothetical protein
MTSPVGGLPFQRDHKYAANAAISRVHVENAVFIGPVGTAHEAKGPLSGKLKAPPRDAS